MENEIKADDSLEAVTKRFSFDWRLGVMALVCLIVLAYSFSLYAEYNNKAYYACAFYYGYGEKESMQAHFVNLTDENVTNCDCFNKTAWDKIYMNTTWGG